MFELTRSVNDTYGYSGLPLILGDLTIEGNGSTIERTGRNDLRLFTVLVTGDLTINNTTLTGGRNGYYYGGAAYTNGGTITLNDSTVSGNSSYGGGGLAAVEGAITVNNSTMTGNEGYQGGAFYVRYGTITINDSQISGNTSTYGSGGVAYGYEGAITINRSVVESNSATYGGGAVSSFYGRSDGYGQHAPEQRHRKRDMAERSTSPPAAPRSPAASFLNNEAYGGGAVSGFDSTITVESSTLSGNSVKSIGGALYAFGAPLDVKQSTFSSNTAVDDGGAIYLDEVVATMSGVVMVGNQAGATGGWSCLSITPCPATWPTSTAGSSTSTAQPAAGLSSIKAISISIRSRLPATRPRRGAR